MQFQKKLDIYADLLISHGLNVQVGQVVNITGEWLHREFMQKLVKSAYKKGAKYVNVDFIDPILSKIRIQESRSEEYLRYVPRYIPIKYEDFVAEGAAILRLVGGEDPQMFSKLPTQKVNDLQTAYKQSLHKYYVEGVGKSKVQWTVAAAATPLWGKQVFPELDEESACKALWESIFTICRADRLDCLEVWKKHNQQLRERAKKLTQLKIKELHFIGPDTDLKVGLTPLAIFKGGGDTTPYGVDFEANIPTEECFTTPNYHLTEGSVRTTRPVLVNGHLVKDLQLEFHQGEIVNFTASEGSESFAAYIKNDSGSRRLGEVALVGIDSPVYQTGHVFEEILFDENAACHIAIGSAYRFCLEGGTTMTPDELETVGCNQSHVHTDFMISSIHVDVNATLYSGESISLIKKGEWQKY